MDLGLSNIANMYYQRYANQQNKTVSQNSSIDFSSMLSLKKAENMNMAQATEETSTSKIDAYQKYLEQKYGNVRIENVGKDNKSLDKIAKTMRGNDVIIAPNIFEEMADNPQKAAYYEGKIDDFFNATPRLKAQFAQGYFVDGKNLFTADFIRRLGFDVRFDEETKEVLINPKELKLNVDGRETSVETVNIGGFNFCPVRSLAGVVGFDVIDSEKGKVYLKTK